MKYNICKEIRKSKCMTQEEFALHLGVTRQTIIRWEKEPDKVPISSQVSILIADAQEAV